MSRQADKAIPVKQATATGPNPAAVAAAIDGDPQTGWSLGGGQGQRAFGRLSTRRTR